MTLTKAEKQEIIAKKAATLLKDNTLVNLGIGLPTKVGNYLPKHINVLLQSENGFTGLGPTPTKTNDGTVVNASGQPVTILPGGAFFDSAVSFGIIRGGHVDTTVLGALQVDKAGNIASYIVPGKSVPGMGGAMDLLVGSKTVIVAMEHTDHGQFKLLNQCTFPLTAVNVNPYVVTELGIFKIDNGHIQVIELTEGYSLADVQAVTEAPLILA